MRTLFRGVICLCLLAGALYARQDVVDQASRLELEGRFQEAAGVLSRALDHPDLPAAEKKQLAFELDRLSRIRRDFPFTQDQLFAQLSKSVRGLTRSEFEQWIREGRFDSREIDGRRYFMSSSVSNLFFRYPELNPRRVPPKLTADLERRRYESCLAIQQAARAGKKPYVLPKRFRATMTVTAKPGSAPPNEMISAWLPVPREYPFQTGFELLSASPAVQHLDPVHSPIRAAFVQQPARSNLPTVFKLEYAYTAYGVSFDLDPARVQAAAPNDPALRPFLQEAPHVVFTPELRALSRQIAGDESNPCRKAKKFYDWIADHIQYSYAIEYSTIRNISDYCRSKGYGDCGQEALLFIALCRLNGIPARWQSGWNTFPGAKSIHDWSEIYLAPYGWMPVDPYMGIFAMRYATSLPPEKRRFIRDFYFGGLDQYRMSANSDHNQILSPPKQSFRSDNVDFQRGELECGSRNLYFDQYSYDLSLKEIELPRPE